MGPDAADFKSEVRARRLRAGLTQAELAEAAGISERAVSDLERGLRTYVYPGTARRLARALGVAGGDLAPFLVSASGAAPVTGQPAAAYRSRLPVPHDRLVGRDADLGRLLSLIGSDAARMVTLVGAAGVGKTRLAVEAAHIARGEFLGGVLFIELSAVDRVDQVLTTVADGAGARLSGDPFHALTGRFSDARTLLILDTLEHLAESGSIIAELVRACAPLQVLSTSRSALNVRGEYVMRLEPLAVNSEAGATSPAARLFLDRASDALRGLQPDDRAVATANAVARRLDGLPLAIELAAARARHMPLGELTASLDRRLETLSGGPRDAEDRHRTMRAALDWSYATLDDHARRQLRTLSVFRGGFDLDAAAAVDGPGWTDHRTRVIEALSRLVDSSLLVFEPGLDGGGRYRVLDVVRDYARELAVEHGETAAVYRRHAEHYLVVAERGEPHLRAAEQSRWYIRLLADENNFRAAMTWALDRAEADSSLRLAASLWMFWRWAGLFAEAKQLVAAALALNDGPSASRLRALWGAGWLAYHRAEYAETAAAGREILRLAGESDTVDRRNGMTLLAVAALAVEDMHEAVVAARTALELAEASGTGWLVATSLLNLGTALLAAGDAAGARPALLRARSQYEELGDRHFLARTLIKLAHCDITDKRHAQALALIRDALRITRELADLWSSAEGLEAAMVVCAELRPDTAVMLAAAACDIREQIAMNPHPADARFNEPYFDSACAKLDPTALESAKSRGAATPVGEALRVAGDAVDALLSGS